MLQRARSLTASVANGQGAATIAKLPCCVKAGERRAQQGNDVVYESCILPLFEGVPETQGTDDSDGGGETVPEPASVAV